MRRPVPILLLLPLLALGTSAQPVRYELGQRRVRLEEAFARRGPDALGEEALAQLGRARRAILGHDLDRACEALDRARLAMLGEGEAVDAFLASLSIVPEARLLEAAAPRLRLRVRRLWRSGGPIPAGVDLAIALERGGEGAAVTVRHGAGSGGCVLPLSGRTEGDHRLRVDFVRDGRSLGSVVQTISFARDAGARVAALRRALGSYGEGATASAAATVEGWVETLDRLVRGRSEERDVAAAALLERAEAAVGGAPPWRDGLQRVVLAGPHGAVPAGLWLPPAGDSGSPVPLVVALHGEGGLEDLFLDTYGLGAAVAACAERGWMLLAPRVSAVEARALPALLDALAGIRTFDRTRVFLVGQSLGAELAMRMAAAAPEAVRGVAMLAGSAFVSSVGRLTEMPILLACGSEDAGCLRVERFLHDLERGGVREVDHEVVPGVERLLLPPAALPRVFDWLDRRAR